MDGLVATRCVPVRTLSRSTAELISRVERDGDVVAVSRNGRLVAVVVPIPATLVLETSDAHEVPRITPVDSGVDPNELELSELAREFIIDAAATPTGFWWAPDLALLADERSFFRALRELDAQGMTEWHGAKVRRITRKGRAAARALTAAGQRGYDEIHADDYHPGRGSPREGT